MSENTQLDIAGRTGGFDAEQFRLITDFIMKGATPNEVGVFAQVCARTNLDPFRKQIHAVQRWDNNAKRMVWSYQTGIDGYRAIANRTGQLAGIDDAVFTPIDEATEYPKKASVTVYKIIQGQRVGFTATARWSEYVQLTKEGHTNSMWRKMPYGQLAKCAEALALRKAFPEELGGVHSDVEMEQAENDASSYTQQEEAPTLPKQGTRKLYDAAKEEAKSLPAGKQEPKQEPKPTAEGPPAQQTRRQQPPAQNPPPPKDSEPFQRPNVIMDAEIVDSQESDLVKRRTPYLEGKWREFSVPGPDGSTTNLNDLDKNQKNRLIIGAPAGTDLRDAVDCMILEALENYSKRYQMTLAEYAAKQNGWGNPLNADNNKLVNMLAHFRNRQAQEQNPTQAQ